MPFECCLTIPWNKDMHLILLRFKAGEAVNKSAVGIARVKLIYFSAMEMGR